MNGFKLPVILPIQSINGTRIIMFGVRQIKSIRMPGLFLLTMKNQIGLLILSEKNISGTAFSLISLILITTILMYRKR